MKPWEIASVPEEAGVSSKGLLRYLDEVAASGLEHHSILVWKDGKLACKLNYAPYDDQTPHVLFSLSSPSPLLRRVSLSAKDCSAGTRRCWMYWQTRHRNNLPNG